MHKILDKFKRSKNQNGKFQKPYYAIQSAKAEGKVLDVCQDGQHPGTLVIWEGHGGENQQFTIKQKGPDYYLKCKKSRQYLTVDGPQDGARIYAAPKTKAANQRFRLDPRGDHEYVIYTGFNKVLDLKEGNKHNGTEIIQWEENGGSNQKWTLCNAKNITSSSSELA